MTDQTELRKEILYVHKHRFATKSFNPTKKIAEEDWMTIMEAARLSLIGNTCLRKPITIIKLKLKDKL